MTNRTIKFRAWDEKNRVMFEPSSISWSKGVLWVNDLHGENRLEYELNNPNAQLMQFTGLLDKNGKEIYEGDVVNIQRDERFSPVTYIVVWHKKGWGLQINENYSFDEGLRTWKKAEVIGNIYENPELLAN